MLFSALVAVCSFASVVLASPIPEVQSLEKRQSFNGRATFYDVGLGACGEYNVESDFIVALNTAQYGGGYPGPNCFKSITISYGGKTAQAKIMDQCPSCGYGDLDLSRSLFNYFSDPGAGVFQMSWSFNGGGGGGNQQPAAQPTTSQKPKTTSTPAWTPPPTSTWTPPSTQAAPTSTWTPKAVETSSYTPTPTTTSSSSDASSESDSSSASSSTSSSTDPIVVPVNATVSGTVVSVPLPTYALPMGNLVLLNQAVTNLGAIVVIGAQE